MIREFVAWYARPTAQRVEQRILHLVRHAWDNVPFYRQRMAEHGIVPADIKSLRDFVEKFPTTTSERYRAYQQSAGSIGLLDTRLNTEDLVEDRSSGSSGVTISVRRTRNETEINRGRALWHLVRAGLKPWHRILAVLPPLQMATRDSALQSVGIFRRTTVNYMMPVGDIVELIRARGINVIYGQKSFIRLIADHFGAHNIPPPKLELLIPGAEKVSESDRRFFGEVFRPTRYCEFYGTTETNLIGAKYDDDYEIDYKAVFFSLRDAVSDGGVTSGSIIVSSLVNEAQPILNVEIGDRVSVRNYDELYLLRATINKIDGRENDYLRLPNGDKISGATFYATLEYFPFMRQFRIVQESLDSCTILLRVTEPSEENRGKVDRAVGDLLRGKIRYNVKYVDDIPIDPNGKTKILSSRIACRADEWP